MDSRILLAAGVLIGGIVVAVAGASPQATLSPQAAVTAEPGPASVKGMIEATDRANGTFNLTDGEHALEIRYEGQLPAAVQDGKSLVASGEIVQAEDRRVLLAEEIQLGCPSKYDA